jgi:Bacterial Ig-like domain (group 2)
MIGTHKLSAVRIAGVIVLSLVTLVWSGCGGTMNVAGSGSSATSNGISLTPTDAALRAGATTQFTAKVTGNKNQAVTWSVNGVASGNATVGTIDATGKYKAPLTLPKPNSVTIKAVSVADKTLSASAPLILDNPIPTAQSVSPSLLPIGNFTLTVGGSNFVTGAKVMFGGAALPTTYVSATQLTATGTSTAAQTGTIKVTVQNPDPGKVSSPAA